MPLVQAEGKTRACSRTPVHPCGNAAHGTKLEFIVWTRFSSDGVLQRTGLGLVPL